MVGKWDERFVFCITMNLALIKLISYFLRGATGVHLTAGFPSCPSGQEHIGRCLMGLHFAVGAHTLSRTHGLWHNPLKHVSLSMQSLSD